MEKSEFLRRYKAEFYKEMLEYESRRKDLVFNFLLIVCAVVITNLVFIFALEASIVSIAKTNTLTFTFSITVICYLLIFSFGVWMLDSCTKKIEDFLMEMKEKFLNRFLSFWGNITWSVDSSIPNLKAEKLIGEYKNIPFKILETKDDIYLTFKSNKFFKYETIVKSKNKFNFKFNYKIVSFICSALVTIMVIVLLINSANKAEEVLKEYFMDSLKLIVLAVASGIYSIKTLVSYKKTKMEDVELTRDFIVYTEDEIDARYFLTPTFIERFKNIKTVFGRKNISCSCKNNEVCFKITKPKNLFEVCNVFKSLKDISAVNSLYNEIDAIFKMIDYFKLNQNTKI